MCSMFREHPGESVVLHQVMIHKTFFVFSPEYHPTYPPVHPEISHTRARTCGWMGYLTLSVRHCTSSQGHRKQPRPGARCVLVGVYAPLPSMIFSTSPCSHNKSPLITYRSPPASQRHPCLVPCPGCATERHRPKKHSLCDATRV